MDDRRARRRVGWLDTAPSADAPVSAADAPVSAADAPVSAAEPPGRAARALDPDPRFPGWEREGEFLFRRRQRFQGRGVAVWPDPFSPEASEPGQLVFYDTETTGLSGGAGSVIFLFGAAWGEGLDLVVEQLFLSDFPGEPDFLLAVKDLFARFGAFVSFNGKTFDSHLLRTRFLMNRIPWEPGPQVDLLHHARRLWKSLIGDCHLKTIEAKVLGFDRGMDIPGEAIPLVWLDFLRSGAPGLLPVVFDHNVMDIVSLARVHTLIGQVLAGDLSAAPVDERAVGNWMLQRVPEFGALILTGALARGNTDAGLALSLHHKRRREWDKAVAIWESMLGRSRSMFAAIELAKYWEHRKRTPGRARELVEAALAWNLPLDRRTREHLRVRLARLKRKEAAASGRASVDSER